MVLSAPPEVLHCRPGQFFHLLCPALGGFQPYLRRPMSIYGYYPEREELHFLYKIAGEGTGALSMMEKDDILNIVGPLGQGFDLSDDRQNLLLVARGVGLATLAPLAQEAHRLGRKLTAVCSARSPDLLMSLDLFRSFGAKVITVTDSEMTSGTENLRHIVEQVIESDGVDAFYTCGSSRILRLLQSISAQYDIPGQVALEQQMACGIGMCQCCVRLFHRNGETVNLRVCREGPVFDLAEVL
jgi:dihydroorotate dehydrogenase electron transfer subunit